MFLQQADTNSKSLLCLHWKAPSATYEAVGDMPPPSGAQQCMIPIGYRDGCVGWEGQFWLNMMYKSQRTEYLKSQNISRFDFMTFTRKYVPF